MAHELVWSPEALEDVEQIATYIARDSEWYAQAVVTRILAAAETLSELPGRGCIAPEVQRESLREIFVYSYRPPTQKAGTRPAFAEHGFIGRGDRI